MIIHQKNQNVTYSKRELEQNIHLMFKASLVDIKWLDDNISNAN
jgi:hypothetical protein